MGLAGNHVLRKTQNKQLVVIRVSFLVTHAREAIAMVYRPSSGHRRRHAHDICRSSNNISENVLVIFLYTLILDEKRLVLFIVSRNSDGFQTPETEGDQGQVSRIVYFALDFSIVPLKGLSMNEMIQCLRMLTDERSYQIK